MAAIFEGGGNQPKNWKMHSQLADFSCSHIDFFAKLKFYKYFLLSKASLNIFSWPIFYEQNAEKEVFVRRNVTDIKLKFNSPTVYQDEPPYTTGF